MCTNTLWKVIIDDLAIAILVRPAYQGTTAICIVEDIESGANTDVEFEEYD